MGFCVAFRDRLGRLFSLLILQIYATLADSEEVGARDTSVCIKSRMH